MRGYFVVGPVVDLALILGRINADVIPGANTDVLLQSVDLYKADDLPVRRVVSR